MCCTYWTIYEVYIQRDPHATSSLSIRRRMTGDYIYIQQLIIYDYTFIQTVTALIALEIRLYNILTVD